MINAGNLTNLINIMQINEVKDSGGGFTPGDPVLYWQTKADVIQLSNIKTLQANQNKMIAGYLFKIRSRKDRELNENMFIVYKGKAYAITQIENKKRNNSILEVTAMFSTAFIPAVVVPVDPHTLPFRLA